MPVIGVRRFGADGTPGPADDFAYDAIANGIGLVVFAQPATLGFHVATHDGTTVRRITYACEPTP